MVVVADASTRTRTRTSPGAHPRSKPPTLGTLGAIERKRSRSKALVAAKNDGLSQVQQQLLQQSAEWLELDLWNSMNEPGEVPEGVPSSVSIKEEKRKKKKSSRSGSRSSSRSIATDSGKRSDRSLAVQRSEPKKLKKRTPSRGDSSIDSEILFHPPYSTPNLLLKDEELFRMRGEELDHEMTSLRSLTSELDETNAERKRSSSKKKKKSAVMAITKASQRSILFLPPSQPGSSRSCLSKTSQLYMEENEDRSLNNNIQDNGSTATTTPSTPVKGTSIDQETVFSTEASTIATKKETKKKSKREKKPKSRKSTLTLGGDSSGEKEKKSRSKKTSREHSKRSSTSKRDVRDTAKRKEPKPLHPQQSSAATVSSTRSKTQREDLNVFVSPSKASKPLKVFVSPSKASKPLEVFVSPSKASKQKESYREQKIVSKLPSRQPSFGPPLQQLMEDADSCHNDMTSIDFLNVISQSERKSRTSKKKKKSSSSSKQIKSRTKKKPRSSKVETTTTDDDASDHSDTTIPLHDIDHWEGVSSQDLVRSLRKLNGKNQHKKKQPKGDDSVSMHSTVCDTVRDEEGTIASSRGRSVPRSCSSFGSADAKIVVRNGRKVPTRSTTPPRLRPASMSNVSRRTARTVPLKAPPTPGSDRSLRQSRRTRSRSEESSYDTSSMRRQGEPIPTTRSTDPRKQTKKRIKKKKDGSVSSSRRSLDSGDPSKQRSRKHRPSSRSSVRTPNSGEPCEFGQHLVKNVVDMKRYKDNIANERKMSDGEEDNEDSRTAASGMKSEGTSGHVSLSDSTLRSFRTSTFFRKTGRLDALITSIDNLAENENKVPETIKEASSSTVSSSRKKKDNSAHSKPKSWSKRVTNRISIPFLTASLESSKPESSKRLLFPKSPVRRTKRAVKKMSRGILKSFSVGSTKNESNDENGTSVKNLSKKRKNKKDRGEGKVPLIGIAE